MTKDDLEAIRQRDKKGFSEEGRTWDTKRITDTPAQMASDRHALLRYIDELRAAPEPRGCTDCLATPDANGKISHKPGCSIEYVPEPPASHAVVLNRWCDNCGHDEDEHIPPNGRCPPDDDARSVGGAIRQYLLRKEPIPEVLALEALRYLDPPPPNRPAGTT
jgi:hypothetical protein